MEGSSVRGQQKIAIVQLNETPDLQTFQTELVRLLSAELKRADVIFGSVQSESQTLGLPAWITSHLDRQTPLRKRLEQGEMVGIGAADENASPRPVSVARSSVVVIPVLITGRLSAAVALVSPPDGPQLSAEEIESARQLIYDSAPVLARLQLIEALRRENLELRKESEQSHTAAERASELLAEKNALAAVLQMRSFQQANIAHELRTPLAAIRGYTRMILDGRGGQVNAKQSDYLRTITENTNRLVTLISWMSYVAELSAHHFKLSTFDFRDVWKDCLDASQPMLARKSLQFIYQPPQESFVVTADREKLTYVVNELVGAAVRLGEKGSAVTVELTHGREHEVTFKLATKGEIIPPDVLSRIFDRPFNAITPAVHNTQSGTINLSGVYDVIGMHGGRVFVNSAGGQGATFLFTLPAVTASEEKSHEQAVNSSRRR